MHETVLRKLSVRGFLIKPLNGGRQKRKGWSLCIALFAKVMFYFWNWWKEVLLRAPGARPCTHSKNIFMCFETGEQKTCQGLIIVMTERNAWHFKDYKAIYAGVLFRGELHLEVNHLIVPVCCAHLVVLWSGFDTCQPGFFWKKWNYFSHCVHRMCLNPQ